MDTSKPLEFDKHGIVQIGPMRIGFVKPGAVSQRRDNPRAMSEPELNALRSSIDSLGFKSFVLVEEQKPGQYGIIDGHHRVQVLNEKKAARIPVVLVDKGTDPNHVDLAMLSFNVTGSPNGPVFVDFVRDLVERMGTETVASHVGMEAGFLDDLAKTMDEALAAATEATEAILGNADEGGEAEQFWQGRPLRIELANTPEHRQLIADVRRLSGAETDGQAVIAAMQAYVLVHESAQSAAETSADVIEYPKLKTKRSHKTKGKGD